MPRDNALGSIDPVYGNAALLLLQILPRLVAGLIVDRVVFIIGLEIWIRLERIQVLDQPLCDRGELVAGQQGDYLRNDP